VTKLIYLLGAGGHGRVVLDTLLENDVKVTGIFDPKLKLHEQVFGIPVLDENDKLNDASVAEVFLVNGLGANPRIVDRQMLFNKMTRRGFSFISIKHPTANIGKNCILGEGFQVMAGSVLQNRVKAGDNVVINTGATIEHDCIIHSHAFVSPASIVCGDVTIGESAFIGAGAVLMPGVKIGNNAIVGAGAVVTKDVPSQWIVAKNPAEKIGMNVWH